jgi:hypothetical protein
VTFDEWWDKQPLSIDFESSGDVARIAWDAARAAGKEEGLREAAVVVRRRRDQFYVDHWPIIGDEHERTADAIERLTTQPAPVAGEGPRVPPEACGAVECGNCWRCTPGAAAVTCDLDCEGNVYCYAPCVRNPGHGMPCLCVDHHAADRRAPASPPPASPGYRAADDWDCTACGCPRHHDPEYMAFRAKTSPGWECQEHRCRCWEHAPGGTR